MDGGAVTASHPVSLWLPDAQRQRWAESTQAAPLAVSAATLSFWLLHVVSVRILSGGRRLDAASRWRLQHAAAQFVHAALCAAAAVTLLATQGRRLAACAGRAFCYDELSARVMDAHVGYLIYELIFYTKVAKLVSPTLPLVFLHHTLYCLAFLASQLYPCRLSLLLLPWHELLGAAGGLPEARYGMAAALGSPPRVVFTRLGAFQIGSLVRAAGALSLAAYTAAWLYAQRLWFATDLPEGQAAWSRVYCLGAVGGSTLLLLVYVRWFQVVTSLCERFITKLKELREQQDAMKNKGTAKSGNKKQRAAKAG